MMLPSRPINLRTHTEFSLLEGIIRIDTISNESAIAITDTHNMFGLHRFTTQCLNQNIHPITGCAVKIKDHKLYLYVQNHAGYKNLCQLLSHHELTGLNCIDDIFGYTDGLLALLGEDCDLKWLPEINSIFKDRWAVALSKYHIGNKYDTPDELLEAAIQFKAPLVASNIAFFSTAEDYEAHDAMMCVSNREHVDSLERKRLSRYHRLLADHEWASFFADAPQAVQNTFLWARKCSFILENAKQVAYSAPTDAGRLSELAHAGLTKRIANIENKQPYFDKLEYELKVITGMGMEGYFLKVADYVGWAKEHNIPTTCRGSGAASVVAWAMRITDIDPLRFSLVFERFLNPDRVSMADFDIDFCQARRDEVIHYIQEKYGADYVAHIATFGTLQARAVLRDVGRVLGIGYYEVDSICKLIPFNPTFNVTLKIARETNKDLDSIITQDPKIKRLWALAEKLEGLPRHVATHAAGIVISDKKLEECIPLYYDPKAGMKITQFDMYALEKVGFIKFDVLGLNGLTMIQQVLLLLQDQGVEIDFANISFADPKVFKYLSTGNTYGIFQLDSIGIRQIIQQMKPEKIENLIALVALYRPGPVGAIPQYLECRQDPSKISYIYPQLSDVLDETYGIIVYQEQVLQIARIIAGYSLGEADLLRRAIGKKIESEMNKQREIFTDRATALHGDAEKAGALFDLIAKFANYGFVKAHATCYAVVMYQMAFLKTYYTQQFICVGMTLDSQHIAKLIQWKREADREKVIILPPCVFKSSDVFMVEGNNIRYSLSAIKNVGHGTACKIYEERNKSKFIDIWDFVRRTDMNKSALEGLIKSGALDGFNIPRSTLWMNVYTLLHQPVARLFAPMLQDAPAWDNQTKFQHVFESIGMYLDEHPMEEISQKIFNVLQIKPVVGNLENDHLIIGHVLQIERRRTKTGAIYGILFISDGSGINEISVFSELWSTAQREIKLNDCIWCKIRTARGIAAEAIGLLSAGLPITRIKCIINSADILAEFKKLPHGKTELILGYNQQLWKIGSIALNLESIRMLQSFKAEMTLG